MHVQCIAMYGCKLICLYYCIVSMGRYVLYEISGLRVKCSVGGQEEVREDNKTGTMYGLICNLTPPHLASHHHHEGKQKQRAHGGEWWWRLYPPGCDRKGWQGDDCRRVSTVSPQAFLCHPLPCSALLLVSPLLCSAPPFPSAHSSCVASERLTTLKHFVTAPPSELWTTETPPLTLSQNLTPPFSKLYRLKVFLPIVTQHEKPLLCTSKFPQAKVHIYFKSLDPEDRFWKAEKYLHLDFRNLVLQKQRGGVGRQWHQTLWTHFEPEHQFVGKKPLWQRWSIVEIWRLKRGTRKSHLDTTHKQLLL